MKHEISINGYIGDLTAYDIERNNCYLFADFERDIADMPKGVTELTVKINSGGGIITEGYKMRDALNALDMVVNTKAMETCGSIATVIHQAGKRNGKRLTLANTKYFIHFPLWLPVEGSSYNSEDLKAVTERLHEEESQILSIYMESAKAPKDVIANKMKEETTFTGEEAVEYGFADEVIEGKIQANVHYRMAAVIDFKSQKTDNTMATLKEEFAALAANLTNEFKNILKGKLVNMTTKTSEGVDIYFEGELMVGSKVFLDESMTTPAPDGVHTVGTKVFTVADGVVTEETEVGEAVNEAEVAAAKIAELEANNAAKEAELQAIKAEKETLIANVAKLQTEFVNFQNKIVTGGENIFNVSPEDKKGAPAKTNVMDAVLELRKSKSK